MDIKQLIFFCLMLAACTKPETQSRTMEIQPPRLTSDALIASDKTALPVRRWVPVHKPEAVIIALHGFNDYSRAFAIPGHYMQSKDIAVIAYDQRGFGNTAQRGIWPDEDNLTLDVKSMVIAADKRYPHVPVYILGESMGGAVAIAAVTRPDFPAVAGIILSAPALWGGETMNPFYRACLFVLAHTWPSKILTGEDLHILASDNIDMLRALARDPLFIKGTRVDAIYGLVQLMDTAYSNISKIKMPMLILYGAHDQVIPPEPMVRSVRKLKSNVTVAYYPLGYHMLLRDLHGDIPLGDIVSWIQDPYLPLPSGNEKTIKKFPQ